MARREMDLLASLNPLVMVVASNMEGETVLRRGENRSLRKVGAFLNVPAAKLGCNSRSLPCWNAILMVLVLFSLGASLV